MKSEPKVHAVHASDAEYGFAVKLMQFLVVPTFVLDPKGRVLIWNKACERLTGIQAQEVLNTSEHWRGFYETQRPCLSDIVVQNRMAELASLYAAHDDTSGLAFGLHAENWCRMPRLGHELYLAIDAGPIYDASGKLLAVVETLRDMTVQKRAQIELEKLAHNDGLTGVFNRRGFDDKLRAEWSRNSRDNLPLSLIMLDVDYFKRYNDTYGHQAGDEALRRIGTALERAVQRPADLVARYGGEEFAVILPSVEESGALVVAEAIRREVRALNMPHSANEAADRVSVSLGVATVVPRHGEAPASLVELADRALYQAKHAGRNQAMPASKISPN